MPVKPRLCGHALAHLACIHADRLPPGDPAPRTCSAPKHLRAACRFRPRPVSIPIQEVRS